MTAPDPFCAPCGDCQGSGRITEDGMLRYCLTCDSTGSKERSRIASTSPAQSRSDGEIRTIIAYRKAIAALSHASTMRGLTGR